MRSFTAYSSSSTQIVAFETPNSKRFSENLTTSLNNENIRTIQIKINILRVIYSMLLDITTFKSNKFKNKKASKDTTPFKYHFDKHIKKIDRLKKDLDDLNNNKSCFDNYKKQLIKKYLDGIKYKEKQTK